MQYSPSSQLASFGVNTQLPATQVSSVQATLSSQSPSTWHSSQVSVVSLQNSAGRQGSPVELQSRAASQNSVPLQYSPSSGQLASFGVNTQLPATQVSSVQPTLSSQSASTSHSSEVKASVQALKSARSTSSSRSKSKSSRQSSAVRGGVGLGRTVGPPMQSRKMP